MTPNRPGGPLDDDRLRAAFRAAVDAGDDVAGPDCVDDDRIWRAVVGDLDADSVRAIVDHTSGCARCAESWRVAVSLASQVPSGRPAASRTPSGTWMSLALAATLLLAIGYLVVPRGTRSPDTLRSGAAATIESRVTEGALPRDRFMLQWTAGPAGTTYAVTVTDEQGRTLQSARDLRQPEYTVVPSALEGRPAGSRVFWRVEARLPDGSTVTSNDFATTVR